MSRAQELIDGLTDLHKIQAGIKLPVELKECDITHVIKESVDQFYETGKNRIVYTKNKNRIDGKIDCNYIRRAIDNLIDNALKYGDNSRAVNVQVKQKEGIIEISVHNHGNPIPPEDQEKLFKRYFRMKDQKEPGWGIGLTFVKGVVEAHGGEINVSSEESSGTIFTLRVPGNISQST